MDKELEKGCSESLCKEQSQITLVKSPLIRSRSWMWVPDPSMFGPRRRLASATWAGLKGLQQVQMILKQYLGLGLGCAELYDLD